MHFRQHFLVSCLLSIVSAVPVQELRTFGRNDTQLVRRDCSDPPDSPYIVSPTEYDCLSFCETSTNPNYLGSPIRMTDDTSCDDNDSDCPIAVQYAKTVSTEFSVNLGATSEQSEGEAIQAGVSWTWTDSTTTGVTNNLYVNRGMSLSLYHSCFSCRNVQLLTTKLGETGHVVFFPEYTQICGTMYSFNADCLDDGSACFCNGGPASPPSDPNACVYVPNLLGSGQAVGVSAWL